MTRNSPNIAQSLSNLNSATASPNTSMVALEQGSGVAHELLYGTNGRAAIKEIRTAATTLSRLAGNFEQSDSLLMQSYLTPNRKILTKVTQSVENYKNEWKPKQRNRYSSSFLRDPTLYEDHELSSVEPSKPITTLVHTLDHPRVRRTINNRANHDSKAIMASLYGAYQSMEKSSNIEKDHPYLEFLAYYFGLGLLFGGASIRCTVSNRWSFYPQASGYLNAQSIWIALLSSTVTALLRFIYPMI